MLCECVVVKTIFYLYENINLYLDKIKTYKFYLIFVFFFPYLFSIYADTPLTSRIIPVVNPSSLQITSLGRVAFELIPIYGQMNTFSNITTTSTLLNFISPEYLNSIKKNITFTESDIEKVCI